MGDSKIQWTQKTWNPVVGCSIVSPGCHHCYAAVLARRLRAMALADLAAGRNPGRKQHYIDAVDDDGRWTGRLIPVPEALPDPASWREPRLVFVNSMSDLFHESLSMEFIVRVFARMIDVPRHTFQVLTKRPDRMAYLLNNEEFWWDVRRWLKGNHIIPANDAPVSGEPIIAPNIHLGTSIEDQKRAHERIPYLEKVPAAVRFLSMEPLLDDIDLSDPLAIEPDRDGTWRRRSRFGEMPSIHWVIVGGESGHKSRPCDIDWIRSIVQQCKAAAVPVFVKQLGRVVWEPYYLEDDIRREWLLDRRHRVMQYVHHTNQFTEWDHLSFGQPSPQSMLEWRPTDRTGGDMAEWPEDLRVREFPAVGSIAV